ncbi:P-loop containing nucleoside triphosphate hydrolase protein [Trametopsis cervina]|nr:P-loop containing nucleoside triphosphate hydrolase protein [Trametopsis cervina]
MTSLRTFQNEIDEIHQREVLKQRILHKAANEKAKEPKKPPPDTGQHLNEKWKEKDTSNVPEVKKLPDIENTSTDEGPADSKQPVGLAVELEDQIDMSVIAEQIINLLLSNKLDEAQDRIAGLLTRNRGEYIFRIGSRPQHERLFAGQDIATVDGIIGVTRSAEDMQTLSERLAEVVHEVGGQTSNLYMHTEPPCRAAFLLRLPPPSVALTPEVRCAVVGNVDSGKSTTLGVLTRGALDDGRGRARVSLFRHKHEIESGRTSSVGMEILGFGPTGEAILPPSSHTNDPEAIRHEKMSWETISIQASKIVSFIDLAGHERYLKTTLYGLTSGAPSCVILIVGANAGLIGMSKEHLAIALALGVPVVVCITKIDMTPPNKREETIKQVTKILRSPGCRKTPVFVKSMECAVEIAEVFAKERLCPIFQLSNVTGEGLNFLRTFLNLLPSSEGDTEKFMADQPLEYCITEVWSVPYVGTVVDGILNAGRLKAGDAVMFGPDSNGKWDNTAIKTIQRKRAPVNEAEAGQSVSLALKRVRRSAVRKGMVIVHKAEAPPRAIRQFEGTVLILYHNTTLQTNYQAMLHCGAIRQTVRIIAMDHPQGILRTGDRATVTFEFISHPEFLKEGMKLLFREGKTKGLGVVTKLL